MQHLHFDAYLRAPGEHLGLLPLFSCLRCRHDDYDMGVVEELGHVASNFSVRSEDMLLSSEARFTL
eukprot:11846110-Alexandrium_andersonii.AAC.1